MNEIEIKINKLKAVAKRNDLVIKFRNHTTNMGDFCIFIYDKSVQNTYMVGFDGNWGSKYLTFNKCLKDAYKWIKERDKRYNKVNDKWVYNPNYK